MSNVKRTEHIAQLRKQADFHRAQAGFSYQRIYALEDENKALREEVAALRKDKARLDRLDQLNVALNAKYGTTYQWQVIVNHNINRLMLGHLQIDLNDSAAFGLPSCRDALDTIMPGALLNQDKENGDHAA
ncbi:TPA: hypothetical protein ACKQDL_002264 [Pseudomonas aeruginosa]